MGSNHQDEGFIIEYQQVGGSVKVTAFDPVTLKEAVIIGPTTAKSKHLADIAVKKLLYILGRDA